VARLSTNDLDLTVRCCGRVGRQWAPLISKCDALYGAGTVRVWNELWDAQTNPLVDRVRALWFLFCSLCSSLRPEASEKIGSNDRRSLVFGPAQLDPRWRRLRMSTKRPRMMELERVHGVLTHGSIACSDPTSMR
jgi:hypothetical protein